MKNVFEEIIKKNEKDLNDTWFKFYKKNIDICFSTKFLKDCFTHLEHTSGKHSEDVIDKNRLTREHICVEVTKLIKFIERQLEDEIWDQVQTLSSMYCRRLFNIFLLKEKIFNKTEERKIIANEINKFGELAESAKLLLLEIPRDENERLLVLCNYKHHIDELDTFIDNNEKVSKGLIQFIANGKLRKIQIDSSRLDFNDPSTYENINFAQQSAGEGNNLGLISNNWTKAKKEIEEDFEMFKKCLLDSIWFQSGLHNIYVKSLYGYFKEAFTKTDKTSNLVEIYEKCGICVLVELV